MNLMVFPATGFPLADLNVAVKVLVFALALYDLLGTVRLPFCGFTMIFATTNEALYSSLPMKTV